MAEEQTTVSIKKIEPIKLKYPIILEQDGGQKTVVEEVSLGRLKAKHLKLLPADFSEGKGIQPVEMFPIIAAVTNLPIELIEEMDMEDMTELMEKLTSFFGKAGASRKNGKK